MHEDQVGASEKEKDSKQRPASNESSSDTDKTSGSLFKTTGVGVALSRIKELPTSFYTGYASLDEFLNTASPRNNNTGCRSGTDSSSNNTTINKTHQKRATRPSHGERKNNGPLNSNKDTKQAITTSTSVAPIKISPSKTGKSHHNSQNVNKTKKNKHQAQDAIDEMNRQYDHNLCLDRFMYDIEQNQKQQTAAQAPPEEPEPEEKNRGRSCNISPSSLSSSSSNMPQSNEDTDSGSRNSESIQSSTPENGKNDKDENNSNINSSNASNSSKEDKTEKDAVRLSNNSEENSDLSVSKFRETSLESGVGSGSMMTEIDVTDDPMNSNNTSEANDKQAEKAKNYKGGKLGRKRKRGYIYNPKPVIEKPPKQFVPEQEKDQSYWDKRQRNNEAARRSREMRRLKEKETHEKLDRLKKENEALRVAITLLIQRNENLEFIIHELEKTETPPTVPVTC